MLLLFLCLAALFRSSLPLSLSEYVDETMTLLTSDGGKVHMELLGTREGTPVLIVHGGLGPWPVKNMAQSIDLEKHFVVYPHHKGWGLSGPTVESGITERHAKDFEEVREALGLSKWKIMAGSNGATLALAYASLFPDRVHFLVLRASWAVRYNEVFYNYGDFEMGKALHYPDEWDKLAGHVGCGRTKETKCVGLELLRRYERKLLKSSEEEAEETVTHFLKWDVYGNSVSPLEDTGQRVSKLSLPWPLKEVALSGI
uniref:AB hydrolase-1 domain-containing protein n=1 Tax=Chromera velia CCMP2878 TaxID=1169474 RepID=A0A0K6S8Q8_9ALVE|eukprot:Cvel_26646.t1-p1 / transcript=Cvel_26646.t1 / gene=Cvel_26646 / organism=Chromera_velia_CCMP2878 / gene_product=Proline iminopeptidase, putative / transcript_product=Proline iminopeptidase, putative / location=Cvel_scaffold3205:2741-4257(-) / protein_length=256 / sequence_SO=supercontig / SO=protein_coding / is_pseudo=false